MKFSPACVFTYIVDTIIMNKKTIKYYKIIDEADYGDQIHMLYIHLQSWL